MIEKIIEALVYKQERDLEKEHEIDVDALMADYNVDRAQAVEALKELERRGYGRFMSGRRQHKTRLVWGMAAQKKQEEEYAYPSSEAGSGRVQGVRSRACVDYRFPLDDALDVTIRLPRDLTKSEADRIARFVHSLVREGGTEVDA